jgi:hypothetical protein
MTGRHRRSGRHRPGTSRRSPRPRTVRPAPAVPRRRGGRRLALVATVSTVLLAMSTSSLGTEAYHSPPPDPSAPGSVLRLPRIPELRIPPIPTTTAASRATVVADIQPAETRTLTHEARPAGLHAQGSVEARPVANTSTDPAPVRTTTDAKPPPDETTTATRTSTPTTTRPPTHTSMPTPTPTTTTTTSVDPPTSTEVTTTSGRRKPPRSCDTAG